MTTINGKSARQGEASGAMLRLVREMVTAVVDDVDEVLVAGMESNGSLVLSVTVAAKDVGKVIGKQGRMARALRMILECAAMKAGVHCELNILQGAEEAAR